MGMVKQEWQERETAQQENNEKKTYNPSTYYILYEEVRSHRKIDDHKNSYWENTKRYRFVPSREEKQYHQERTKEYQQVNALYQYHSKEKATFTLDELDTLRTALEKLQAP